MTRSLPFGVGAGFLAYPGGTMYHFTPPTSTYRVGRDDRLWCRVINERGNAVVIYDDGRIVTAAVAPSSSDAGVSSVWPGGRTYLIDDDLAGTLTAAGYGSCLEVVA